MSHSNYSNLNSTLKCYWWLYTSSYFFLVLIFLLMIPMCQVICNIVLVTQKLYFIKNLWILRVWSKPMISDDIFRKFYHKPALLCCFSISIRFIPSYLKILKRGSLWRPALVTLFSKSPVRFGLSKINT